MIHEMGPCGRKCVCASVIDSKNLLSLGTKLRASGKKIVCSSCPADPLHNGHVRCFQETCYYGDVLVLLVNDDNFLIRKKGYSFMPLKDRLEILSGIRYIDYLVPWEEDNVSRAILALKPDVFTKGGDRKPGNLNQEEMEACHMVDCRLIYGVGGTEKLNSSQELIQRVKHL